MISKEENSCLLSVQLIKCCYAESGEKNMLIISADVCLGDIACV